MINIVFLSKIAIVDFLSLLVGVVTLLVALKVHKEFVKNHARAKQVESVCELVKFLNNTKIFITFANVHDRTKAEGSSTPIYYNIFEIGNLLNTSQKKYAETSLSSVENYDNYPVFLNHAINQIFNMKEFIDNPFIPKEIADHLNYFYVNRNTKINSDSLEEESEYFVILNNNSYSIDFLNINKPCSEALKSWLNFKTHSYNLTLVIKKWFELNGIKDINLRIDYKNLIQST